MLKRKTFDRPGQSPSAPRPGRAAPLGAAEASAPSRRDFLRNSGLMGLALGAGWSAGTVQRAEASTPYTSGEVTRHKTICHFCSVGCSVWAEVQQGVWIGQEPVFESPVNQGTHCAKGAAMREIAISERRLKYPMKKEGGVWKRISWDQAMQEIAEKQLAIREKYGPDSSYWLGSAKFSNEQSYLFRKFVAFWGTNNIDHQARICHSTTVAGVANTFGYGAMTNTFNDIRNSRSIIILGGNPAEAHPVSMLHVLAGKENGAPLIVVDPRFTRTAAHADEYVRIRPGADVGFINGLIREILANGWEDREYLRQRVFGLDELRAEVEKWTPEEVERVSGIPADQTRRVARTLAENRPGTLIWCMGLTQSHIGNNKTRAASILQLVLGNIGKSGGGTNIFRGHDNVQGATDMGVSCDTLPAYYGLSEGAWKHWARVWGVDYDWVKGRFGSKELMEKAGMPVSRWLDGVLEDPANLEQPNPVKAMTFWGHAANSLTRGPEQRAALDTVELLTIIDPHPTQVAIMTDKTDGVYLLPAASTAESHGTVTNSNRSVQMRDQVVDPIFESKTDYEIVRLFAEAFGFADKLFQGIRIVDGVPDAYDLLREINRGCWTIGYTGQSPERLRLHMDHQDKFDSVSLLGKEEPVKGEYYCLPWPAWGKDTHGHPGTPLLYDTSKSVREGGLPFRARWGVEHEGRNLLAEDSFTKGSEIRDGYPEGTIGMLQALGWAGELTDREMLIAVAIAADRFSLDMLEMPDAEVRDAMDRLEEFARQNRLDRKGEALATDEGSWQGGPFEANTGGNGDGTKKPGDKPAEKKAEKKNKEKADSNAPTDRASVRRRFPDYPDNAITAISAYLADNPQDDPKPDAPLRDKIMRVNWKTDLSGGVQRVMLAHNLAPYGNGKARMVVWNFPDPVPVHREPLYTVRRDLLPEYKTLEDRRMWRLPVLYESIQEQDYSQEFPMILTSGRLVEFEGGGDETRSNKWLAEFQQQMFVEINPADAGAAGIENKAFCWVRTPVGNLRVQAMVTRRVDPGVAFMPFHFAGMWMGEDLSHRYPVGTVPYVIGEASNTAQTYGYDSVTQMQETKATICRIEPA
ncbi:formate dehydrogenase [Brevirhabdus pacifica]|uniref:Formate dehydrogenase n=2 Tax=Brevirhabdus pacifica TaxID=1267768 RepID=A0A1U7DKK5_9RHOB|nr:formate dehydrogenase subunit alpha [Brevirhabdus pacifica]APX90423.1 formate dehydrogenase [Brevirhabdus pacifica]PJJ85482.1 formate dehydrogenase major subunit [Brevirhabdus pacifica]